MPEVSVIICTHNPRQDYLRRTLEALRLQTLPREKWEFLLIDNASNEPLTGIWDLSWHPRGRHIFEAQLGLTRARLRGIQESHGEILIFVDDDNILEKDYLEKAMAVGRKHSHLGIWGGNCIAEFEVQPPFFLRNYLNRLAVSTVPRPRWTNSYLDFEAIPCGAGIIIRRVVADRYQQSVINCNYRTQLGRTGNSLASCEDIDLVWTAVDLGFSAGRFPELQLTHIIPRRRVEPDYLLALIEGDAASRILLDHVRKQKTFLTDTKTHVLKDIWLRFRLPSFDYKALRATRIGIKKGITLVQVSVVQNVK